MTDRHPIRPQRHFAAILAIAKDEDPYLVDWARHHLSIGFDHIYLYDNMSARYAADVFADAGLTEHVTCTRWPSRTVTSSQVDAYQHFVGTYGRDVEWAAAIDIDEFVNLKRDASIRTFLARFPDAVGIALNWRIFGSAGHAEFAPDPVIERFQKASNLDFGPNAIRKTIHRMPVTIAIDIHRGAYSVPDLIRSPSGRQVVNENAGPVLEADYEIAQVNHYFVKSYAEWQAKLSRGYPDQTVRPLEMFHEYDRNEVHDASILRSVEEY
jgi:hypothetical protein